MLVVLNAFRHQRTYDEHRQNLRQINSRVLNAFRHQRTYDWEHDISVNDLFRCAQRLSASTDVRRREVRQLPVLDRVLNAFRHQRTYDNLRHCSGRRLREVLNAFRHQRTYD